ncbi:hypothetical protein ACIA6C_13155 [Streptomyces sp. NPDC051578]|uniref:hypothetical protein n=1 Tax=Streptomyces sp. NPDC051578 TaxID=3365662 RepID=UPI0037B77CEF
MLVFDLIAGQEKGQGGRPPMSGGEGARYKRFSVQPSDPVLRMALQVLSEDFRYPLSPGKVLEFQKLFDPAAKTPAGVLIEALRKLTPGGLLKPDMLGLQSYGELAMEEVEVGTRKGGLATYKELQIKLSILEDPCAVRMRLELARMQRSFQVGVRASTWRLHPALMLLPLPLHIDTTSRKGVVSDRLCFWPTSRARFNEYPRPETGRPGYDGLVLYHVHRAAFDSSLIPKSVRERMNQAVREWARKQRAPGPTLVPELVTVMQADRRLFPKDGELFLAGLGATALLALFVWVAVEAGVIAGLAAAGQEGLSALAAAPAVLAKAVVSMAEFSRAFLAVATQLAFTVPPRATP